MAAVVDAMGSTTAPTATDSEEAGSSSAGAPVVLAESSRDGLDVTASS
jgi:hypothetical protein